MPRQKKIKPLTPMQRTRYRNTMDDAAKELGYLATAYVLGGDASLDLNYDTLMYRAARIREMQLRLDREVVA
jgi:hypothetical protein